MTNDHEPIAIKNFLTARARGCFRIFARNKQRTSGQKLPVDNWRAAFVCIYKLIAVILAARLMEKGLERSWRLFLPWLFPRGHSWVEKRRPLNRFSAWRQNRCSRTSAREIGEFICVPCGWDNFITCARCVWIPICVAWYLSFLGLEFPRVKTFVTWDAALSLSFHLYTSVFPFGDLNEQCTCSINLWLQLIATCI